MKNVLLLILSLSLLLAGCTSAPTPSATPEATAVPSAEATLAAPAQGTTPAEEGSSPAVWAQRATSQQGQHVKAMLEGTTANLYDGLTLTAMIDQPNGITPGAIIPIKVSLDNKGERTILYTQGSGSYTTPDAVVAWIDGLQNVPTEDRLGMATADFVTKELKPGEKLEFTLYACAIKESVPFLDAAFKLMQEGTYVATLSPEDLLSKIDGLEVAEASPYSGGAFFFYQLPAEEGADATDAAQSFIEFQLDVTIAE